jgi:NADH:ubiquinone oxidoreductase subunit 6 (subunit J)
MAAPRNLARRISWVALLLLTGASFALIVAHMLFGTEPPEGLPADTRQGLLYQVGQLFRSFQLSDLLWFAMAGLTLGSAAGVAFSPNIIYSAFSLLGAFLGVAAMYIYLSAPFLAVTQVLIYVGGVLVLILFAVMLTSRIRDVKVSNASIALLPGIGGLFACFTMLAYVASATPWPSVIPVQRETSALLGDALLSTYLLPFEIISVVLLATLIGAIALARRED